jgi:F1F0 ATPase subunit 2
MNEEFLNVCALLSGVLIGLIFFGGLRWTVHKAMSSRQPGLLFAGSMLLRTVLTLAAFYLVGSGSWQRLVACLVGFTLGRIVVNRFRVKRFSHPYVNTDCGSIKEGVR